MDSTCARVRSGILAFAHQQPVHLGSSLSVVEILAAVLSVTGIDPANAESVDRSRIVLSKGHAVWAWYALLAEVGIPISGDALAGHPVESTPVLDGATGALGHGLAIGAGLAVGARLDASEQMVFVILGDGELDEGSVWEAALFASHQRLDHLVAVVDRNGLQQEGATELVLALEPLQAKWESFGWDVETVDGHDFTALSAALSRPAAGRPRVILARTVKGKGISFMEHDPAWHAGTLDDAQWRAAMADLSPFLEPA